MRMQPTIKFAKQYYLSFYKPNISNNNKALMLYNKTVPKTLFRLILLSLNCYLCPYELKNQGREQFIHYDE